MRALVKAMPERGITMMEQPVPICGHNDVMVKIKKTAICGTDLHIYLWDEWAQKTIKTPMITGHEFVGEICQIGEGVSGYELGERVSGEGHITCGVCRHCRGGTQHLCPNTIGTGVNRTGCFADYLVMPATNIIRIPDNITDDEASIFDPFGNAAHTALSFNLVGEDVLITGAGPIGIMAVAIAQHVGARHVVITDVNEYRLDLARKMGATHAVNTKNTELKKVISSLGMTEGFDVGLEMSGNPHAFKEMLSHMSCGGKIALLGILPDNTGINWTDVIFKGLFIKGIYGREMYETWYKMIAMLQSGLNIKPVITHHYKAENYLEGFEMMASGQSGKVILTWSE